MKVTLFFCAGNYAETLGIHRVDGLDGVGRRMPATSAAFTIGAFGMIGTPPLAGFVSKWTLGSGALAVEMEWVVLVLVASSLLNAAYFLPVVLRGFFGARERAESVSEAPASMVVPLAVFFALQRYFVRGILAGSLKG